MIDRVESLEKKVAELERARKRERIAGAALVALVVAVACKPSTVQTPGGVTSSPATAVFRAATADGQREALLTPDGLVIKVGGKERAKLVVTADGGNVALALRDSSGAGRLALQASDGPVGLSLLDHTGKDALVLAADERDATARVELFGPEHLIAAVVDSHASLALSGADGKSIWHAP